MEIKRIDSYSDCRFSKKVLKQHGAFEVDDLLYEVEIISDFEAIVHGSEQYAKEIIEEFRFYSEHILMRSREFRPIDAENVQSIKDGYHTGPGLTEKMSIRVFFDWKAGTIIKLPK